MYTSQIIDISDIPEVAFDSMNQTHEEEIVLVNKLTHALHQGLQGQPDNKLITERLNSWIDHTREHFASENKLMEECGFPALSVHKGEHQAVLALLEDIQRQWSESHLVVPLAEFVFNEWYQWFESHVNTMDMVTAQYLNQVMSDET